MKTIFKMTILYLLMFTQAFAFEQKMNSESLEAFKVNKGKLLEKSLANYLGKIKFSSFVNYKTKTIKEKKKVEGLKSLYLFDQTTTLETEDLFEISSIEVKVIVFENIKNVFDKEINNIVESVFDNKKIKISISYTESTRPYYEILNNPENVTDISSFLKSILARHISEVVRLFGVVIFCIVAILGIFIFARLLKGPLNSMAESLKNFSKVKSEPKVAEVDDVATKKIEEVERGEIKTSFEHNLKIFEALIHDRADAIAELVLINSINASGIRKTLPYIYNQALLSKLKEHLTNLHMLKLSETIFEFPNNKEYMIWFNSIVERLSLGAVIDSKCILAGVSGEKVDILKKIPTSILKKYIEQDADPVSLQIILDLLSGEQKINFMQALQMEEWKLAIDVKDVTLEIVNAHVDSLITFNQAGAWAGVSASAEKLSHDLVIPNLISILKIKKLKEQDAFLDELSSVSPDVIKKVQLSFWTPKMLLLIPVTNLKDYLLNLTVEDKVTLFVSLPEDVSRYMLDNVLEGKQQLIVKDLISSEKNSEDIVGQKMLIDLRESYLKNEFELIELKFDENKNKSTDMDSEYEIDDYDNVIEMKDRDDSEEMIDDDNEDIAA